MSAPGWGWTGGPLAAEAPAGPPPTRWVVKFGGSLLERRDWPSLARGLLGESAAPLVVVGGGGIVEGLRALDATAAAEGAVVHRLALDGMGITARYVAAVLGLPVVTEPGDGGAAVLDMAAWLDASAERHAGLPRSWQVTSDSLAARVAIRHGAALVLAKSVPPPLPGPPEALAAAGWVDAWFPSSARGLTRLDWRAPVA